MTYTWQADVLPTTLDEGGVEQLDLTEDQRSRLEVIADEMIPEAHGMPAASSVGIARHQLDLVLRSRPDLAAPLVRAVGRGEPETIIPWLSRLRGEDPESHDALVTVVLAGYYLSDEVKRRLGYPGQEPSPVNIGYPRYVEEGLLDAVIDRGPRYRRVEDGG